MDLKQKKPYYLLGNKYILWAMLILWTIITWLVKDNALYWDTIQLAGKHGYWYYEQDFRYFFLPADIDSGHPPIFGMYLALVWSLCGKTLAVSHLAMLPFILGIIYLLPQIGQYYLGKAYAHWWLVLALCMPALATQLILVSPDVPLIFFFLLAWYSILQEDKFVLTFATICLAMISTRGMMLVFSLYCFELTRQFSFANIFKKLPTYIPSGILALAFLYAHYVATGWIGYHEDSPWAANFAKVGFGGFVRNIFVLGFRFLDQGIGIIWLTIGASLYYLWPKIKMVWQDKATRELGIFLVLLTLLLTPVLLIHRNLIAYRYLLPIFLVLLLFVLTLLRLMRPSMPSKVRAILLVLALGLISGNFWRYPEHIAQGWDTTLAHLPHYQLRNEMKGEVDRLGIPMSEIGTTFPEIGPLKFKDLNDEEIGYVDKDLDRDKYVLISTVMNDFSDEERARLQSDEWALVLELKKLGISYRLYQKQE